MARVTDRGQALLVGAVVLAVAFLGLALVLNGAIYETTLSTEASEDVSGNGLVTIQDAVRGDVATVIERAVNRSSAAGDQKAYVEAAFEEGRVGANYTRQYAERDVLVRVSYSDSRNGSVGEDPDFTTLSFSDRMRVFRMTFNNLDGSDPLTVSFEDTDGSEWNVTADGDSGELTVDPPSEPEVTCANSEPDYVDFTNGSYRTGSGIERCPALNVLAHMDGVNSIEAHNGSHVSSGSYRYFVNDGTDDRIYQVSVDLVVYSESIDYEGTLRVAPGEPR
ncbi:DUF7261 family protein [Halomicrobium urmianum]|uniref:DUF7261 family protein n=1 Tax=Halomicrobium urmianum TaxID=1586233 RepID=UPI001CD9FD7A|nr:hypothetical protein [Halomicrobium urmianum]